MTVAAQLAGVGVQIQVLALGAVGAIGVGKIFASGVTAFASSFLPFTFTLTHPIFTWAGGVRRSAPRSVVCLHSVSHVPRRICVMVGTVIPC